MTLSIEILAGPVPYVTDDWQGIGYTVRLMNDGKEVLTTDYRLGIGHVELPKMNPRGWSETEIYCLEAWRKGRNVKDKALQTQIACKLAKAQRVMPKCDDVIYSLLMDSEAIDYPTFEQWCDCVGYDKDSRKAESIYRACLETGLKLRSALGDKALADLREKFTDY